MGVERGSGKALKKMLKRCSSLGKKSNVDVNFNGVPKGHFVVYVGHSRSRHVIPISFLTHPIFQVYIYINMDLFFSLTASVVILIIYINLIIFMKQMLLQQSEEEFGFFQDNGLTIPCDEHFFRSLISSVNP